MQIDVLCGCAAFFTALGRLLASAFSTASCRTVESDAVQQPMLDMRRHQAQNESLSEPCGNTGESPLQASLCLNPGACLWGSICFSGSDTTPGLLNTGHLNTLR